MMQNPSNLFSNTAITLQGLGLIAPGKQARDVWEEGLERSNLTPEQIHRAMDKARHYEEPRVLRMGVFLAWAEAKWRNKDGPVPEYTFLTDDDKSPWVQAHKIERDGETLLVPTAKHGNRLVGRRVGPEYDAARARFFAMKNKMLLSWEIRDKPLELQGRERASSEN